MDDKMSKTLNCKICEEIHKRTVKSVGICQECNVYYCYTCSKTHIQKVPSHTFIMTDTYRHSHTKVGYRCDSCNNSESESFCTSCTIHLCRTCLRQHKTRHGPRKITEQHETNSKYCFECIRFGTLSVSEKICAFCIKRFCEHCYKSHMCPKCSDNKNVTFDIPICEPCDCLTVLTSANSICVNCDEFLCPLCSDNHKASFVGHKPKAIRIHGKSVRSANLCENCNNTEEEVPASYICVDCNSRFLCELCAAQHITFKQTRHHRVSQIATSTKFADDKETQTYSFSTIDKEIETSPNDHSLSVSKRIPGKPEASYIGIDSITIIWEGSESFDGSCYYQVSYQETDEEGRWKLHDDDSNLMVPNVTIPHLKTNTAYRFRVRVVTDVGEGPYSPISDRFVTRTTSAGMLMSFSRKTQDGNPSPAIYALPLTENESKRNTKAATRWFEIGEIKRGNNASEKTIMMFGTSGCGKKTLVDNIINYILGVQWTDNFRFTTMDTRKTTEGKGINVYSVRPEQGSRLQYRLNIIDVSSFNDSNPLEENLEILRQIRILLSDTLPHGLEYLDAICFIVKSTDKRLSDFHNIMFQQVLSIFGKDIGKNVFALLSFADQCRPPVLRSIQESGLPIYNFYTFNSSALFLDNVGRKSITTCQMFWHAAENAIGKFLENLSNSQTISLELTKCVIDDENILRANFAHVQRDLDNILQKVNDLRKEQSKIEQQENTIKTNSDFEYTTDVTEQTLSELQGDKYALNCLNCKVTCSSDLHSNQIKVQNCDSMDPSGVCKACVSHCPPESHVIQSKMYTCNTNTVTRVDQAKKAAYDDADIELRRLDIRVNSMASQMHDLCDTFQNEATDLVKFRQKILDQSLWPRITGIQDEIELRISMLIENKPKGYIDEIRRMKDFKKYLEITSNLETFAEDARSILNVVGRNVDDNAVASANMAKFMNLFNLLNLE